MSESVTGVGIELSQPQAGQLKIYRLPFYIAVSWVGLVLLDKMGELQSYCTSMCKENSGIS